MYEVYIDCRLKVEVEFVTNQETACVKALEVRENFIFIKNSLLVPICL